MKFAPQIWIAKDLEVSKSPPITPLALFLGTAGDDTYQGGDADDRIEGRGGGDTLYGGGGNDTIYADDSEAKDFVYGEAGEDILYGTVDLGRITAGDYLDGGEDGDTYYAKYFTATRFDDVHDSGSRGIDTVIVPNGEFTLSRESGIEVLRAQLDSGYSWIPAVPLLSANNMLTPVSIYGNDGKNTIQGGNAADHLEGGKGDDTYYVNRGDTVVERAGEGNDTARAFGSYTLGAGAEVENLSCWGTNVDLTGNEIANTLIGNDTANILNGGGGDDVMIGDTGADTYVVDSSNDTVNEAGTDGAIDIVSTSLAAFSLQSYALVENLYAGNASGAVLTGNALSNRIVGHNGADVFDGGSGGIDNLEGARGNDVYYIRTSTQNAQEEAGFGTDEVHVKAAIDYALTADSEVELLQADGGYASTVAVKSLKGGKSANSIISNAGDTTLDGGGGAGDAVDVLHGGIGDDTYVVRRSGDIVEEAVDASGGTQDVVEVYTGSYTLIDTMGIEVLQAGGTTNIDLTGNAHANTILGNGGANTLRGNGGNDLISGGGGIDTVVFGGARADYTVTRQLDGSYLVADKRAGLDGQDKLVSIERFQFADKLQSETELTPDVVIEPEEPEEPEDPTEPGPVTPGPVTPGPGTGGGASAVTIKNLSLTGTKAKDQLIGGKGNDTFFGKLGNDMLIGSDGRDLFVFDTKPDARKNLDWITDFTVGQDRIGLDGAVFKALPKKGSLAAPAGLKKGAFFMGKEAKAADDRIVYDAKKGALFYDADGKGGADQIQIAKLAKGLKLSAQDFFVV